LSAGPWNDPRDLRSRLAASLGPEVIALVLSILVIAIVVTIGNARG
jgi:hypothetical protein